MFCEEILRKQILDDLERLHGLIIQYAEGDRSVKRERDRLEGALQIKFAIWHAMAPRRPLT